MKPTTIQPTLLGMLTLALAACSHGSGAPPATDKTVEETLHELGVDTSDSPRLDDKGEALPEGYSPLGQVFELEKLSELMLLGITPLGSTAQLSVFDLEIDPLAEPTPPVLLHSLPPEELPWAKEQQATWMPPASRRAAARADLDGDGREELALVWTDGTTLHLALLDDDTTDWARSDAVLLDEDLEVLDVSVAAGDLDGDGAAELAIAYSLAREVRVVVAESGEGGVEVVPGLERTFENEFQDSLLLAELEIGDLDYDAPQELALVLNEYTAPVSGQDYVSLGAHWAVLDDMGTGLAPIAHRVLKAKDDMGVTRTAVVADVALGDLDSDGIDELALAGLWTADSFCAGEYVLLAVDDAAHELESLAAKVLFEELGNEPGGDDGCEVTMLFAHVGIADMENDSACEIVVNEMVFADFATAQPWTVRAQIPDWFTLGWVQDPSQSAMAFGDFTGDGRADVATWAQGRKLVSVHGIDGNTGSEDVELLRTLQVAGTMLASGSNPILLPLNPDDDTTVLEFVDRKWILTEPMVMAVLAAAPGKQDIGQNTDACTTEYGEATSSSTGSEFDVSVTVNFAFGGEFKQWGTGFKVKTALETSYEHTWTSTYTLTTSISYETGPLEDTVVCLVTPYDHYTYRVLADPDPEAVGKLIHLSVPRVPISLQVERSYYNDSVASDELKIDASVLSHTPGVIESYPSVFDKDALLASWVGMQTGPASVGQGSGSTTLGIAVTTEEGSSDYLSHSREVEVEASLAGVAIGGSIGIGAGHTWSRSVGSETTYSGTVGSIDAEHFVEERYDFGLFVYTRDDEAKDQSFDVIQYWIE
jgi:hypothetical protein